MKLNNIQIYSSFRSEFWNQLGEQLRSQIDLRGYSPLDSTLHARLDTKLRDQLLYRFSLNIDEKLERYKYETK